MIDLEINCFKSTYRAARQCLLDAVSLNVPDLMREYNPVEHPLPGPDSKPLYMDWIELGQVEQPENLLVLISGTHGVEGFAGSAIQSCLLPFLAERLRSQQNLGIILLHALNPWGFAWQRRYDHDGIDINRNFIDFQLPLPGNPVYDQLHSEIFDDLDQPLGEVFNSWQQRLGKQEFEAAITQGQYHYADGLFFGGTDRSWSNEKLQQLCDGSNLQHAKRVAVIDLHTGLGPYGYGEVINDYQPGSSGFNRVVDWYQGEARSALLGESYSAPKTGLLDYFWHSLLDNRGSFVTLEFGTYDLQKLLLLLCEEQRYQNSCFSSGVDRDIQDVSVIKLKNFFYPADKKWQTQILQRSQQVIDMALVGINR